MQAIHATRPGGHVGFVGVSHDVAISGDELFMAGVHIHGGPAPVRRFLPDQLAKRGNALRVMAEAVRWSDRGARINTISPGIIFTPLARDELTGPRGEGCRRMIELSPARRGGTPVQGVYTGARCPTPFKDRRSP